MGTRRVDLIDRAVAALAGEYSGGFKADIREWLEERFNTEQLRHAIAQLEMQQGDKPGLTREEA